MNPVVPAFKSLKARREYEESVANLRHSTSRLLRPASTPRYNSDVAHNLPTTPRFADKLAGNSPRLNFAELDFDIVGGEKRGKSFSESQVASVRVHAQVPDNKQPSLRRVRFDPEVRVVECDGNVMTAKPSRQTPLKSAVKKASGALEDFQMFKELLKQAPAGASRRQPKPAKDVAYPELRMTCPTCEYTWLDVHRKNEVSRHCILPWGCF